MIIVDKEFNYDSSKKFVFIVSSYNCSQFIYKNLDSIKKQNYSSYRIIYVNDNSTDNSQDILNEFSNNNPDINIELIKNNENMGPAYSRHLACTKSFNDEICVFLDGDDWLINNNALQILSYIYTKYDIYSTFGSMYNEAWQYDKWVYYDRKIKR